MKEPIKNKSYKKNIRTKLIFRFGKKQKHARKQKTIKTIKMSVWTKKDTQPASLQITHHSLLKTNSIQYEKLSLTVKLMNNQATA